MPNSAHKISKKHILIKKLGSVPYQETWDEMKKLTEERTLETPNQLWVLEHPPVFTLGQAGKIEHLLMNTGIPVVKCDRGGQITYHGPGQIVVYILINLRQLDISVKCLVRSLEQAVINTLNKLGIPSYNDELAPGVYTTINNEKYKICSIGLRVKRGCTYHGLAFNYDMDLTPFNYINPCGFKNLKITQVKELSQHSNKQQVIDILCQELTEILTND